MAIRHTLAALLLMTAPVYAGGQPPPTPTPQQQTAHASAHSRSTAGATAGATGGAGGTARASGGQAVGSVAIGSSIQAPPVGIPSVGGGGFDCPTVGFGAGGSGIGGGGGFGPSWISPSCNTRKLAELLLVSGHRSEAISLLRKHFPEVDDAFSVVTPLGFVPSPWCASAPPAARAANASCTDMR